MPRPTLSRYPSPEERYAAAMERPAPRAMLVSRALWIGAAAGWFVVWLIVRAARAFWSWA